MVNRTRQTDDTDNPRLHRDELARICKAMGHPIRMQIIQFLKAETQCFCGELVTRARLQSSGLYASYLVWNQKDRDGSHNDNERNTRKPP